MGHLIPREPGAGSGVLRRHLRWVGRSTPLPEMFTLARGMFSLHVFVGASASIPLTTVGPVLLAACFPGPSYLSISLDEIREAGFTPPPWERA